NIGPFGCGGLVTIDSKTHKVRRSGMYHAMAHYSRHVKRGAVRIDSHHGGPAARYCQHTKHGAVALETQEEPSGLSDVAFENPDGEKVMVVTNGGKARKLTLQIDTASASIRLAGDSVTTFVWR